MLICCAEIKPRSRVKGRLRPYADWRSAPLTRRRGDTITHGSKRGSFVLTAMQTGAFSVIYARFCSVANTDIAWHPIGLRGAAFADGDAGGVRLPY